MATTQITTAEILAAATKLGRAVEPGQATLLAAYLDQLIKWNRKMNLVGPHDWRTVFNTLVVDSLYLADFLAGLPLVPAPLTLDLGAGAGIPGIPLRTIWQAGEYWLVEVRDRRATFMSSILGKLKLPKTHVFHGKGEDAMAKVIASGHNDTADLILSRAFMPWPQLLEFVRPLLNTTGTLIILANTPPPSADELPQGWRLGESARYAVAKGERFFWALRPE